MLKFEKISIVLLFIFGVAACSQLQPFTNGNSMYFNQQLHDELIKMADEDQQLLAKLSNSGALLNYKDSVHPQLKKVFERNTKRAKEIIAKNGWPTIKSVGEKGSTAMWLIVQHSVLDQKFMQSCVTILEKVVKNDGAKGWQLAFLQDRVNTMAGKEQIYGTQFNSDDDGWPISFPISNPEGVNARRKALGLNSLEERLQEMIEREKQRREQQKKTNKLK